MAMHVVETVDSSDRAAPLAAPLAAARDGRVAAMSRRRALAAGRPSSAITHPTESTPRGSGVTTDGLPPARLARALSMQRRRQLSQGKRALNGAGTPVFVVYRGGAG